MSIFDTIKSFFAGGSRSGRLYVVDAAQLAGGNSERLGPRDQVQVLQHLSRFAEKEKISVQAVFEGRELREVAHGENYGGVQVFFADSTANLQNLLLDLFKKGLRSKQAVLVTASRPVEERAISMGGSTMRPSTFRKAFENGGGGDRGDRGGDRGDRGGRGGRGGRDRRRGPPRQQRGPQDQQQQPQQGQGQGGGQQQPPPPASGGSNEQQPPQNNPPKGNDSVRDLIDLVE
jgi:hypothetical protein